MRVNALVHEDVVQSEIFRERLADAEAELERARAQAGEATVRSPLAGTFVLQTGEDLLGRYVGQGDVVGFVIDDSAPLVRVVVPQDDVALLREKRHRRLGKARSTI